MPTPHRSEKKNVFLDRCMGDAEARASFPHSDQRFAFCSSQYERNHSHSFAPSMVLDTVAVRRAEFMGRTFRVVAAVLVRAQILHNNLGRSFLPAAEITDAWADQWNGIPVIIGEHPNLGGEPASGRDPDIWNQRAAGWVFSARAETTPTGDRRLVGEVWLDEGRAEHIVGLPAILAALDAGQRVELSTGFATIHDVTPGMHNGQAYDLILHPQGADHLVVSTELIGACSVGDGCGLGTNCRCGGKCTSTREDVPVVDSAAKRPVGWVGRALERVETFFAKKEEVRNDAFETNVAANMQRELEALQMMSPSDQERQQMVREALQKKFGASDREVMVCDLYSETKQVVFWYSGPTGATPKGSEYYRSEWSGEVGVEMAFSDPVLVRKMTAYEPVPAAGAGSSYNEKDAATDDPAAPEQVDHQEEEVMNEAERDKQITDLTAAVNGLIGKVTSLHEKIEGIEKADESPAIAGLKKSIAKLSEQFSEMSNVTKQAVDERERERQAMVQDLSGNFRVPFTTAELETKPIEELRKLQEMSKGEDFSGRGGPKGVLSEQRFVEPVPYWKTRGKKKEEE